MCGIDVKRLVSQTYHHNPDLTSLKFSLDLYEYMTQSVNSLSTFTQYQHCMIKSK